MLIKMKSYIKTFLFLNFNFIIIKNKNKFCGIQDLNNIDTFLDVGANIGAFIPKIVKFCNLNVRQAILIEPDPRMNSKLRKLKSPKINYCNYEPVCLSNKIGNVTFQSFENGAVNSLLKASDDFGPATEIEVMCTTGDKIVEKYSLDAGSINLLKIDVQGVEVQVLEGFEKSLNFFKYVICEISFKSFYENQSEFLDILKILNTTHLYVGNLSEVYNSNGKLDYMNAVFVRR